VPVQTLIIGSLAGLAATLLSVLVGVTAAYLGGIADHILSVVVDIFLVIPALPLMIIIAAYAKGGGMWVLIGVIAVTGWVLRGAPDPAAGAFPAQS